MKKEPCYLQDFGYERFEIIVGMIGGKWKLRIIYMLAFHEVLRYGELKRLLAPITHKMLTNQLKELEKDGLIIREPVGNDLRLKKLVLTEKSMRYALMIREEFTLIEDSIIRGFSEEEKLQLRKYLERIKENLTEERRQR